MRDIGNRNENCVALLILNCRYKIMKRMGQFLLIWIAWVFNAWRRNCITLHRLSRHISITSPGYNKLYRKLINGGLYSRCINIMFKQSFPKFEDLISISCNYKMTKWMSTKLMLTTQSIRVLWECLRSQLVQTFFWLPNFTPIDGKFKLEFHTVTAYKYDWRVHHL